MTSHRRRARSPALVAAELGLEHDPEQRSVRGFIDGRAVGAGATKTVALLESALTLRRTDSQGRAIFRVGAALDPPLDLGLAVMARTWFAVDDGVFTADQEFEHRFVTRVDEPHRARALLEPDIRARLMSLAKRGWTVWLADGGVLLQPKRQPLASELRALLELAASLVSQLEARRQHVAPAKPVAEVLESWRLLASERGLALVVNPLCLESAALEACTARVGANAHQMRATARFVPPLDLELFGKSTRNVGLAIESERDVTSGDLDFDTVFELQARDESELRALFGRELRRTLLELAVSYEVSLDDRGITLRAPLGPASVLGAMLDHASAACSLLARTRTRSVYR